VRRLVTVNVTACALLIVQYLLGMMTNLFAMLPASHPGAGAPNYFSGAASGAGWVISDGPGWAAAHATFGLILAAAAIATVILAWRHGRAAIALATLGALAIVGAAFNGVSFVNYGHDFSSMIMAALWALALSCYLAGALHAAMRPQRP
jgi:hypothetical protein